MEPRWGSVEGGTIITFHTTFFDSKNAADVSVKIDGLDCDVTVASNTMIQCTTRPRPGLYLEDPSLEIYVQGRGKIDTREKVFRYVSLWSQSSTWGGQFAPVDGESVAVPKGLNLLVDIDHSPELNMVLVNGGSIIFPSDADPNHERTFDAKVIFVKDGLFEAGTEDEPYSSKLTITLHGKKYDPTVPIYGNKVLGIRFSTLDIHGLPRTAWTSLDSTVVAGGNTLTLVEEVDWKVGEKIMITSTSYNRYEAEEHTIANVSTAGGKTTVTIDGIFANQHYAGVQSFGTDSVEIRAEVALMERNVIFQGDEESFEKEFGAHIMIHAPGDNANIGRISNV